MAAEHDKGSITYREWQPGRYSARLERPDTEGVSGARVVSHGLSPFVADIDDEEPDDIIFRRIGHSYLKTLQTHLEPTEDGGLGLPAGWLDALDPDRETVRDHEAPLRWLEIWGPGTGDEHDGTPPRLASWRLVRTDEKAKAAETTIVMVAAEVVPSSSDTQIAGLGFGLRVPITVTPRDGGLTVAIRSMSAELPYPPHRSITEIMAVTGRSSVELFGLIGRMELLPGLLDHSLRRHGDQLADQLQLGPDLVYEDIRLRWHEVDGVLEFAGMDLLGKGVGAVGGRPEPLPYAFTVRLVPKRVDGEMEFVPVGGTKHALTSHADPAGTVHLFEQDPPSWRETGVLGLAQPGYDWRKRRPSRRDDILHAFRTPRKLGNRRTIALQDKDFIIRNCPRYVRDDPGTADAKTVTLPQPRDKWPPIRSNDFSAISAFVSCKRFFEIVSGFGIPLASFVVAARRKIQVFYRSGTSPGPGKDGQTINAQVRIVPARARRGSSNAGLPTIEMHLALAELWLRARSPGRTAEPLGIAASERWMWHEFGHVLLAARFGQLEFDFAHSPGDGMAAVMTDPFSRLADRRGDIGERFRGITFPWVFATRRHDRSVRLGWAWYGALNRSLLAAPSEQRVQPKGYITEQILSSTLFRLYRTLGGDAVWADGAPNFALRERASFVTLFLLIQAVRSMAQPPSVAEGLEAAMEEADTGLASPLVFGPLKPRGPLKDDASDTWIGGRAHKVVRWAFEAQGMFPPDTSVEHNAPGRPMPIDIYIPDRRPLDERTGGGTVRHRPGSYVPVSLAWDGDRLWQAGDAVPPRVAVRNRGHIPASDVRLRGWWGVASGDPGQHGWDMGDRINWHSSFGPVDLVAPVTPEGEIVVEAANIPEGPPAAAGTFRVLVIEVTCPDDRANSDPIAMLATAIDIGDDPPVVPRHLADLVANDNNLALWQL